MIYVQWNLRAVMVHWPRHCWSALWSSAWASLWTLIWASLSASLCAMELCTMSYTVDLNTGLIVDLAMGVTVCITMGSIIRFTTGLSWHGQLWEGIKQGNKVLCFSPCRTSPAHSSPRRQWQWRMGQAQDWHHTSARIIQPTSPLTAGALCQVAERRQPLIIAVTWSKLCTGGNGEAAGFAIQTAVEKRRCHAEWRWQSWRLTL